MTGTPRCSVIIPTYNRMELLRYTLESLARQTLPTDEYEVLVVDDGSSDATASVVRGFRDRLDVRYFFQPDEGWRVAKARNVGIVNARADKCVFIDSGVLAHSGCLAAHVETLDTAGPVAVCGYVYCFDVDDADGEQMRHDIDVGDPDGTIARLAAERRWLDVREMFYEQYTDEFSDLPAPWVIYWSCNVSAHTADLRGAGLFDEAFRAWGVEDMDLAYRLHRRGVRFVLDRRASAIHYPHYKNWEENESGAVGNWRHFVDKHRSPITDLLLQSPEIHPFNINDIIRERGLRDAPHPVAPGHG
jgi:glycosyltransferase involved in cell wall biosynthesis